LKNSVAYLVRICFLLIVSLTFQSCGVGVKYSMTGAATEASSISITEFYNNADLGPANMGQTLTNSLKNYFIQNSALKVVQEEGELLLDGEITNLTVTPIAATSTGNPNDINTASSTRLTITVKVTYTNTLNEQMSFNNKTFSFYKDFPSDLNFADVQDQYVNDIFRQIIMDIFNASVANW
jgi:hypothetical protein